MWWAGRGLWRVFGEGNRSPDTHQHPTCGGHGVRRLFDFEVGVRSKLCDYFLMIAEFIVHSAIP